MKGARKLYPDVYPSGPYASTRGMSGAGLIAEAFKAPPDTMPENAYAEHHIMVNFNPFQRMDQTREGRLISHALSTGDAVITPAGMPNSWRWDERSNVIALTLTPAMLTSFAGEDGVSLDRFTLVKDYVLAEQAAGLILSVMRRSPDTPYSDAAVDGIMGRLVELGGVSPANGGGLGAGRLRGTMEYMEERCSGPITVREMASAAGLSPYHFSRQFRADMGCSPHRYLLQLRLGKALRLLRESNRPLAVIAAETGFADQSHFSNCFRRRYGVSPSRVRRG